MLHSSKINKRTVPNKRTGINKAKKSYKVKKTAQGWISLKLISTQCLISPHRHDIFLKINKRTCVFIKQVRVGTYVCYFFLSLKKHIICKVANHSWWVEHNCPSCSVRANLCIFNLVFLSGIGLCTFRDKSLLQFWVTTFLPDW